MGRKNPRYHPNCAKSTTLKSLNAGNAAVHHGRAQGRQDICFPQKAFQPKSLPLWAQTKAISFQSRLHIKNI